MASRRLEDLHPAIQAKAAEHIKACEWAGIQLLIYCTYRSAAEQKSLYAQGRTKPGAKVTWTLKSKHSNTMDGKPASLAYDCVPILKGKAVWSDQELYAKVGNIGKKIGLTWGGDWKVRDSTHFEIALPPVRKKAG
jgi:peptidoglycan LD-endopeptidase CwlK